MRRFGLALIIATLTCLFLPAVAHAAADDLPGTTVAVGQTVTGTVDSTTKPNDVWAIQLNYGEEILFSCQRTTSNDCVLHILAPASQTLKDSSRYWELASKGNYWSSDNPAEIWYTPAVSGTYYIWVEGRSHGAAYKLWTSKTGTNVAGPQVPDIFGVPMGLGTMTGVVDSTTCPNAVYAVKLFADEPVTLQCQRLTDNDSHVRLLAPSSATITDSGKYTVLAEKGNYWSSDNPARIDYTPARDGTYYIWVEAGSHGATYSLTVSGSAEKPAYPSYLRLRTSATLVRRGRSVTLTATLVNQTNQLVPGRGASLLRSFDGKTWKGVKALSSATGRYSVKVKITRKTWFRLWYGGDGDYAPCVSRKVVVGVRR